MGQGRRHGGHLRRPHQLRRCAPHLGLSQRGPRHDRFRIHHRRAQRHRLPGPAVGGVGRQPHGPRARRHRERGLLQAAGFQTGRRRVRRGVRQRPASQALLSTAPRTATAACATPWWAAAATPSSARCTARRWRSTASSNWWPARFRHRPTRRALRAVDLGLADDRNHGSWQDLLADELRRGRR